MKRDLILEKLSTNRLNPTKAKQQLRSIRNVNTEGVEGKISGRLKPLITTEGTTNYRYSVKLTLNTSLLSADRANLVLDIAEKAARREAERQKWRITGEAPDETIKATAINTRPTWELPQFTQEVYGNYFDGIIDREAHVRVIHESTEVYVESEGKIRNNTILFGEAGACKSSMFEAFTNWYNTNQPVERVHRIDAPTITKAGIENWILDRADNGELPEILYFEEIEKFSMDFLLSLGPCMDGQGVMSKLNARIGQKSKKVSTIFWMTCNDEKVVQNWHRGFIWSRCNNKLECHRPSRQQMENEILPKKVSQMKNGRTDWIKPACDFAYDVLQTTDPREIVSLLCGRNRLLTGEYQKDRLHILRNNK